MSNKPTYEELEQRVKGLEQETLKLKQAEEVLKEEKETYRLLVETSNDLILIIGFNGYFTFANNATLKAIGFEKNELLKTHYSDLIPEGGADLILSVEPMESLRYLPFLSKNGWLITNSTPFVNIPNYPEQEEIENKIKTLPNNIYLNADKIAKDLGNSRGMNMVIAGASSVFIDIPFEKMEEGIRVVFGRKGESIVEKNLNCLRAGREYSEKNR